MSDAEINSSELVSLRDEVRRLRDGIRRHRDEKGHDRCWLDDQRLYSLLSNEPPADFNLPDKESFLENCALYWINRSINGKGDDRLVVPTPDKS
jgi:hypothetical protein